MKFHTKLGLIVLFLLIILIGLSKILGSKTFTFEFKSNNLRKIIDQNLGGKKGTFAVYIEALEGREEKYSRLEKESFPAASLYKLILLSAVLQEIEEGKINLEEKLSDTKTNLTKILKEEDFGYQEAPEKVEYTVSEALERIGAVSDNFAAIMLTEKLRVSLCKAWPCEAEEEPLGKMAKSLGLQNTFFDGNATTSASDMATFFRLLYKDQVVSKESSEKITKLLSLSKINDRLPAKLPSEVRVVHKSGELAKVRHDAGIVYCCQQETTPQEKKPYLIILLSKDLEYEDEGVEILANISKEVYDYFRTK